MRDDSQVAYAVSASEPTSSTASTMLNRRSNARLRSASTALPVSSATTTPRTWSPHPHRMRRADDHRLAVGRRPAIGGEDAGERAFDVAAVRRAVGGGVVAEILGRLVEERPGRDGPPWRGRSAPTPIRPALAPDGGFSEPARASTVPPRSTTQMRAVVRDRPSMICAISGDADGGSDAAGVRGRRRARVRTTRSGRAASRTGAADRAARWPPPARCPRACAPARRAARAPARARTRRRATAAPGTP